jgi:hypothetical protein
MKRFISLLMFLCVLSVVMKVRAHDVITTKLTWDREISRIVVLRCAVCHHTGGRAFSLMTYAEARPWAVAIKEEILSRRMPPWGAVKGFGDFRNDQGLTSEQIEWITAWVGGGVPEGDPADLETNPKIPEPAPPVSTSGELVVSGDLRLTKEFTVDGILPLSVPDQQSMQIIATLPGGRIEPLIWLYEYKSKFAHPFLLQTPLKLPKGTLIVGVPKTSKIALLPMPNLPVTAP